MCSLTTKEREMPVNKVLMSLLFSVVCASGAQAVPVLNKNASLNGSINTIYPDRADPNLFYIGPSYWSVCLDSQKTPLFLYQELQTKSGTQAIVQVTFCPRYNEPELAAAKKALLARKPKARFMAVPFASGSINVGSNGLGSMIVKNSCTHPEGMVGRVESCSFQLSSTGRRLFIASARSSLAMVLDYEYVMSGLIRTPNGKYIAKDLAFGAVARVDGLSEYPELFRDVDGNAIDEKK
jgi:hypothetical protein